MFKAIFLYFKVAQKFIARYTSKLFQPKLPKASDYYPRKRPFYLIRAHQKLLIALATILFIFSLGGQVLEGAFLTERISQGVIGLHSENNLPPTVLSLISQPLIGQDKSGKPIPVLATSWQVNSDATLYTFYLKDDLVWSDLTPVKSSDISLGLSGAEVIYPDDKTIQVKLAESFSALPSLLTNPVLKKDSLVGTGPYFVTGIDRNQSVVVKAYLKPVHKSSDLPMLTINFYPDERTAKVAYEMGQVDSLLGSSDDSDYLTQPHTRVAKFNNNSRLVAIFYNTKDPILSDKNFRKALNSAAPNFEGEERAKTIYPSSSWVFNESLKDPLGNIEAAKDYLSKVQAGKNSTITLTTTPNLENFGLEVVRKWKEAGVNAILRIESGIPQNFQALLIIQPIPLDPDQYSLWHSTQASTNISKYSKDCCPTSARVDKDLEDGRKSNDAKERRESYLDLQKVLMDDVPATPLFFSKTNVIYRKRVEEAIQKVLAIQFPN